MRFMPCVNNMRMRTNSIITRVDDSMHAMHSTYLHERFILFSLCRTSQQASSKYTPFELLYKRKARLPIQVTTSAEIDGMPDAEIDLDQHMQQMLTWAEEVDSKAKQNIKKAQQKQKKQYDVKHRPPQFKGGDKVWVYNARKDTRKGKAA